MVQGRGLQNRCSGVRLPLSPPRRIKKSEIQTTGQAGITLWKLKKYIENEVEVKTPEKYNGKARPTRNEV